MSGELTRNLVLTLSAVFVVTLILIGDIRVSLWVFASVAMIVVEIAGTMQFWGLTIEIVTSICLILAVGLAVDYSAHIGHMYIALSGARQGLCRILLRTFYIVVLVEKEFCPFCLPNLWTLVMKMGDCFCHIRSIC